MKLRLNKALRAAVLSCGVAALSCGMAQAAYVWKTGEDGSAPAITTESWNNHANWDLTDNTTWPGAATGKGPGVPGSNAWNQIVINNGASGATPTLEGWCVNLNIASLTQEDGTVRGSNVSATVKKLQGGCHIEIGKGSTLTLQKGTSDEGNDGMGGLDVTLNGTFNMALFENLGVDATNIAYGDISAASGAGILNMSSTTAESRRTTTAINLSGNLTDSVISDAVELHSITLMTYTSDVALGDLTFNFTATDSSFLNAGSSVLTATEDNVGKYSVVNANGAVTLYYVTGLESMLGGTWTLQEGESANLSEQSFSTASRLVLSVTATEAAGDAATYTIDSNCSLDTLTVNGGAAKLNILADNTFESAVTKVSEGASLSYTGGGNLVLHGDASVDDVRALTGSLTISGATLSIDEGKEGTFELGAAELILRDNATFSMLSGGHTFSQKVTMDGGTVYVEDGNGTSFSFSGGIKVGSGGATISSHWDKNFDLGDNEVEGSGVEGSGKLTLATTDTFWGRAVFNLNSSIADGVNVEVSDSVLNINAGGSFGTGTLKLISNTPADANKVTRVNLATDAALTFAEDSKGVVNVGTHTLTAQLAGDMAEGFRFEGTGTIELSGIVGKNGVSLRGSTNAALQSSFTGTINIHTTNGHVGVKGSGSCQLFKADEDGNYASLHFASGAAGKVFGIAPAYTETNALKIGNLTSAHSNIQIRGDWDSGNNINRYLEVHQTMESATFSGIFATAANSRNVGLIKTGIGNLMLTGTNTSTAKLKVNGGTLTLKDGGTWAGAIEVGSAGTLAFNGADKEIAANKTITFDDGATLAVTGGSLTLRQALSVTKLAVSGEGTVTVAENLTLTGTSELAYDKVTLNAGKSITTGENGSLTSDGITYAKGAVLTRGENNGNLSAYAGGFSVTGGDITIKAGTGGDDRNISMEIKGGNVVSEVVGKLTLTQAATMDSFEGGSGGTTFNQGATFNGESTFNGASTITGDATFGGVTTLNGDLTVTGSTTLSGESTTITLADGTIFTTGNEIITNLQKGSGATISGTGTVSVATAGITYTNTLIDVTAASNISTIAATLRNSKVINSNTDESSSGVNVSADSLADGTNDVAAEQGDITITGVGESGVTVQNLTVESGKEVSATAADGSSAPAAIVVADTANVAGTVSANVTVESGQADAPATFSANEGATVNGSLTVTGTGKLAIVSDNALTVGGDMTLLANSVLDVSALGITQQTGDQTFVIANAASFTIDSATTVLGLDAGLSWTLTNSANQVLLSSSPSVGTNSVAPAMFAMRNATDSLTLTVLGSDTPTLTATAVSATYVDATKMLTITVESLAGLDGKGFNVSVGDAAWESIERAMSGVNGGVYNNAFITLTDKNGNSFNLTTYNGGEVTLNGYTGTGTKGEYFVAYIPEPATATLSLLALAALAARRRRK